jgi:hypothetical protein
MRVIDPTISSGWQSLSAGAQAGKQRREIQFSAGENKGFRALQAT